MKKAKASASASDEMDIEEWEFLSDEDDGDGGKGLVSIEVLDANYFPPPSPRKKMDKLVPIPIQTERMNGEDNQDGEAVKVIIMDPPILNDQGLIPPLIFNNNQFVDMNDRAMKPDSSEEFQFPAKEEALLLQIPNSVVRNNNYLDQNVRKEDNFSPNVWKWKATGIKAFCSIGLAVTAAAAATVCIFIIGAKRQSHKNYRQSQHFRFQIYTHDKRIKQVVRHATRLNQAITAVAGVPITSAHITIGGYYEGL